MQSDNQRISELCSVVVQRICFAASALVYTGSREVNYKFPFGFCAYRQSKLCLQLLLL